MFDHRDHAGIADQGRAKRAETVAAAAAALQQLQRNRSVEQQHCRVVRQRQQRRQFACAKRAVSEPIEQPQPNAGEQDLRIDEAGTEVEQGAGPSPRDRPRQQKTACKSLESVIGDNRIAQPQQPIP